MMSLIEIVSGIFKPAAELIDNLHTSEEERLTLSNSLRKAELSTAVTFMDYEKQLLAGQTQIIIAEAQGGSVLQRSWRPITMLTFLALVVADQTGMLAFRLAPEAWTLLQLGLGGYVVGRSVEKTAKVVTNFMKK